METVRELLDLPIEKGPAGNADRRFGQPEGSLWFRAGSGRGGRSACCGKHLCPAPANLMATLRDRVADPASIFYCPGSLLQNEFDPEPPGRLSGCQPHGRCSSKAIRPIASGPASASRSPRLVARYPKEGKILQSGWLLGEDLLRDQADVMAFRVGKGYVVTMGSQVDFRAQPRATFKLVFNALFHGPSTRVPAAEIVRLTNP